MKSRIEKNFAHARKAHPAFIVHNLAGMVDKPIAARRGVTEDEPIEGCDRRHVDDPFGDRNRADRAARQIDYGGQI
jgi:hypothetical protein